MKSNEVPFKKEASEESAPKKASCYICQISLSKEVGQ